MFFEFNFQDDKEDPYMSTTSISNLSTEILVIVLSFLPIEDLSRYIKLHTLRSLFVLPDNINSSYIHYIEYIHDHISTRETSLDQLYILISTS